MAVSGLPMPPEALQMFLIQRKMQHVWEEIEETN